MEPATYLREAVEAMVEEEYTCPRCESSFQGTFSGPCPDCVAQLLREQVWVEPDGWDWEAWSAERSGKFEPAMHVQPNAVALKD